MIAAGRYDRILITLSMVALAAMVLSGQARAQSGLAGPARIDRYGGEAQPPAAVAETRAQIAYAGRALDWSGKSGMSAPPIRLAYAPAPRSPTAEPSPSAPPSGAALALRRALQPTPPQAAPAADAAPPQAVAAARAPAAYSGSNVRHYSVHRDFGIAPDPTPIPPQFFTATADLSAQSASEAEPLSRTPSTQSAAGRAGRARTTAAATDPS